MGDGPNVPKAAEASAEDLPSPQILARLVPYLTQSVMVVRRDWTVAADLGPPSGVLGRGNATGLHPFSFMHPDDVERISDFANEAMRTEPGWSGSAELRAQRGDGTYGRFRIDLHNRLDDPILQGVVVVSHQLPSDQELTPSFPAGITPDVDMGAVGDHLPIGVVMLDHDGHSVFANRTACELLGTPEVVMQRERMPEGLADVDQEEVLAIFARLRRSPGRESFTFAITSDKPRLLSCTFVSRSGGGTDGAVQFVIVTLEDVTHRLAYERRLEHRANHDSLTGLPNRSWLLDHMHERLDAGTPLLVAFIDLDGFKGVNDQLGHAAGDDVLAEVAQAFKACLRADETVARVGGDEFVVVAERGAARDTSDVAPAFEPAELNAEDLRQRLRGAVAALPIARRHEVGVSIGVTASRVGDQPWDLLGRADAAMYAEKHRDV